jgi:putative nucleotidyltransferase with HDIG domain
MIEAVNSIMVDLQRALAAHLIYPPGHYVEACRSRLYEKIVNTLEACEVLNVFMLDDRVVYQDQVLPASESLIGGIFGALYRHGVDQITFRRGIHNWEMEALLNELAACEAEESRRLIASEHIAFSYINDIELQDIEGSDGQGNGIECDNMAETVNNIWGDISGGGEFQGGQLTDLVSNIAATVSSSSYAMLPLTTIKKHDEYTFIHTINVAVLATAFAEALNFDETMVHGICIAALLHDIGKCQIPDEILNKSGKFSDEEFKTMQRHPVEGARMLLNTPGVSDVSAIVAYEHHIHSDFSGYPSVPEGWKLNLASRVVQVADVFDALRTHRPYRAAMPLQKIKEIMLKDERSGFDSDLVQIFFQSVVPDEDLTPTINQGEAT